MRTIDYRWLVRKGIPIVFCRRRNLPANPGQIGWMFFGTWGDFAQSLEALSLLKKKYPKAKIWIIAPGQFFKEFASIMDTSFLKPGLWQKFIWLFNPLPLMLVNTVGAYKVRAELLCFLWSRASIGFSYPREKTRWPHVYVLQLPQLSGNFARYNLSLVSSLKPAIPPLHSVSGPEFFPINPKNNHQILFHFGSVTIMNNAGPQKYWLLLRHLVSVLQSGFNAERIVDLTLLGGPSDDTMMAWLKDWDKRLKISKTRDIISLNHTLKTFQGIVLCFDSFMAHICDYYKVPAIVLFWEKIPVGYDCSHIHMQLVLEKNKSYNTSELWRILGINNQQNQPFL